MVSKFKTGLILLSIFIVFSAKGQDKEFSKSTLKYGIGIGASNGHRTTGGGGLLSIGYQRDLWKDRLRLNPNLTFGYFNAKHIQDIRAQWFNSINLEVILYFDIIRLKAFSLTIGAGGVINNTKGLLGTGGYPPSESKSDYISDWHYGGFLGGGLRINPRNSRIVIEIMPLNLHVGLDYYLEGFAKIGLEVKLK
ncbi:MAG: hypothetical protein GY834_06360 [Bacteroidetes bacterium]|nr:hypothetical protein [Bacteroidota bacterium]